MLKALLGLLLLSTATIAAARDQFVPARTLCDLVSAPPVEREVVRLKANYVTDFHHYGLIVDDACPAVRLHIGLEKLSKSAEKKFYDALFDEPPNRFRSGQIIFDAVGTLSLKAANAPRRGGFDADGTFHATKLIAATKVK